MSLSKKTKTDVKDAGSNPSVSECSSSNKKPQFDGERNITEWQHGKTLGSSLMYLCENGVLTDVSFRCKNQSKDDEQDKIKAHKIILAARSPVFKAMFYGPCSDGKSEQDLPEVDADIFHLAVKFMYTDSTDLNESVVFKVLEIAHMYEISGLVNFCTNFLGKVVEPVNAVEILEMAFFYDLEELKRAACKVIDSNARQVLRSDRFLQTSEACVNYILKGDTLFEEEADIIRTVELWAERKLAEKPLTCIGREIRRILGSTFFYLRVPTLSIIEYSKFSKGKGYYSMEEMEDLVAHISDRKDVLQVACHSAVKRVPRNETLTIEPIHSSCEYENEVKCKLLLKVTRDCSLTGIVLPEMKCYLVHGGHKRTPLRADVACICLKGSVSIEDHFQMQISKLTHADEWSIILAKPVKLKAQQLPYVLRLHLQLDIYCSEIQMCVYKNPRRTHYRSGGCTENRHGDDCASFPKTPELRTVYFAYCKESENINLVKSVYVCNESNRSLP